MKYKVILDRSIFHGKNFRKIQSSKLLDKVKKGKIRIYFTTVFWEETLRYEKKSKIELAEQLNFLFLIDSNKWFRKLREIIDIELHNRWGEHKYYLYPKSFIVKKRQDFLDIANGKLSTDEAWLETEKIRYKQERLRAVRKQQRYSSGKSQKSNFDMFFKNNVDYFMDVILLPNHPGTEKNWHNYRKYCKLTESYARAFLSLKYLACFDNIALDKNDRWDAEQLSYLIWVNGIVSEEKETSYMKRAFNLLYSDTAKKFFCLDNFLSFVMKI